MLKKFLSGMLMFCIIGLFSGCSDDSNKTQVTKPATTNTSSDSSSKTKLYTEDLKITQDEFVAVYNDVLKNQELTSGNDYSNLKITFDDPKDIEYSPNGAIHFYSGERAMISLFRNTTDTSRICAAMITAKTNQKLSNLIEEVTALTQASTQKQNNLQNILNLVKDSLQSQTSNATSIDGLVVSYNSIGNYLTIIAEESKVGNGFERMVDNIIDSAKVGGYWHK